jgi:high-affinity nickel-transport protein
MNPGGSGRILPFFDRVMGRRITPAYGLLLAGNAAAWLWAVLEFGDRPVLLGTAFLAYSFGLRHGFDADHIAAIDNATRKLMQEGERPVSAGLFFALGHSSVVVGLSIAVALTAASLRLPLGAFGGFAGTIGTSISALFLFAIAAANTVVLMQVYRAFRTATAARTADTASAHEPLARGLLARLFRPVFGLVRRSWHMYPVGVLFGLGFDTATEIGLLGIAAAQASHGLPVWSILVFAALFTAGMTLVDMTDSILMVRAYGWAFVRPVRKLYYNLTITFASVVAAVFLASIETLGLIGGGFALQGPFWRAVDWLGNGSGIVGYGIFAFFMVSWLTSVVIYKARGYERRMVSA